MRYEDNSQAGGIAQGQGPDARDDLDQLTAGTKTPAEGNVITGEGTKFGPMSSDQADGAHITKLAGAHGTDSSAADGKLAVQGEFGQLTMDAQGNYHYTPKANVPENSRDIFTYTLADSSGRTDTADLTIEFGKTPPVVRADAQQIVPGPDGVVVLPEGVQLSDVIVVGRNLVINLPDGTQMVIVDGAVFVPQLVLGGVEVPPTNLASLLIDSEPTPGAGGPPPSSGGNFEVPVPPLDPGVPLGDLIPPTEMVYTPPEVHEVFPEEPDNEPTISIDPGNGVPVINAVDQVSEAGLPTRNGGEPAGSGESADGNGSNNSDPSEATTGTILYDSPDGVQSITITGANGVPVAITGVGQVIVGEFGTLTITSIANGAIGYNYVLSDNTSGDNTHDDFSVTITDSDGDQATATLQVNITDDVPHAVNDTDSIASGEYGPATGNVITDAAPGDAGDSDNGADTVGADNAHLTAVSGAGGSDSSFDEDGNLVVHGQYGTLTIDADGNYEYVRDQGTPGGVSDVFTYTLTDGDGDTSNATLTITIDDAQPITGENAGAQLDDDALANGNPGGVDDDPDAVNTSGTLAGSGGDGPLTWALSASGAPSGFTYQLQGNGDLWVMQGGTHVLTVTLDAANGQYNVSQVAPIDHAAGGDENNVNFTINYTVSDVDGDSAAGSLSVNVDDDTPTIDPVLNREGAMTLDESLPSAAAAIDTGAIVKGDDPDLAGGLAIGSANSGSAIVDLNASFGADGAAAGGGLHYELNVTNASSGLTLTDGSAINLVELPNGVVVGVVDGGAFDGQAAFAISIDPVTGVVSVEQYLSLDHPVNPDPNDPLSLGEDTLSVVGTATDGDGDTVSTGDIDISHLITFLDDGPSIDPVLNADATVTVDESLPSSDPTINLGSYSAGDDPDLAGGLALGHATSGVAIVDANAVFGADGPAAGGGIGYALSITNADPGLTLTDGTPISLVLEGGVIVGVVQGGSFDGDAAFAIAIDPVTGVVTVEQYLSLDHPVNPNPNDPLGMGDNTVAVVVTATDGDGDPVNSDAIDISGQITFLDDGPTVDPTVNAQATVTVDESAPSNAAGIDTGGIVKGDDPDLAGGLAIGQANSGAAIVNANAVFGADGPAAEGSLSYALSIINATSGLSTTEGDPIELQLVNGVIVGVVDGGAFDGQAAFAIAINSATGVVTVEQYLSLDHPVNPNPNDPLSFGENIIGVTVTATDGDGDPVTSDAVDVGGQITFLDDGPVAHNDTDTTDPITDQAVGNVITGEGTNEGTGNADNPGADGFGSITNLVGFNGSTDSDPTGGFDVNGQYGTLHMNADGSYTYTRTGGPGGALENFLYTYVDGDGDPVNATLQITIADNTPTLPDPDIVHLDDDVIPGAGGNVPDGPGDDDPDVVGQNVVNGQLNGSGGDGTLTYAFTGINGLPSGQGFSVNVVDADTVQVLQNGTVVLTVDLNLATGAFTVTQNNPIEHPSLDGMAGDNTENNLTFTIGVEVEDIDGDTDPAVITINVDDDTPTIDVTAGSDSGVNLTTDDFDTIGVFTDTASSSANFGGVFGLTQSAGADGTNAAATLQFALDVTGYSGGPGGVNSGLESHDADIFLYEIGGKVVGSTSATLAGVNVGNTIFDVSVNGSGVVTLTQYQQIDHDTADPTPTGAPFADHIVSLTDSLITLTASASLTDKDGDTVSDSETINIGANLHFTDDGPSAAIVTTGANVSVDETNGNQGDSNDVTGPLAVFNGVADKGSDPDMAGPQFGTNAAAIVASTGSLYGADGAGSTVFGLAISSDGVDSGLNTTDGHDIVLHVENGIVVGRVVGGADDGKAAFAIAIDPSTGAISMVEYMSIQHTNTGSNDESASIANGAIQATVTVTDFDGDTATNSVNIGSHIQFQDDGPTAAVATTGQSISVDETAGLQGDANDVAGPLAVFNGVAAKGVDPYMAYQYAANANAIVNSTGSAYGADGPGTTTFSLAISSDGVDSGLNTTDGHDIVLHVEGGIVVGRVVGGADDGKAAFAVAIDSTGHLSMVEFLSIQHPNTGSLDESVSIANGAIQAVVTVTDGDNDSASNSVNIGGLISFQDDGPTVFDPEAIGAGELFNQIGSSATADLDVDANIINNFGSDGPGLVQFANIIDGQDSGETSGGDPIEYWLSNDGQTLEGRVNSTDGTDGTLIYTVQLNQGPGTYTVTMSGHIDNGAGISFDDLTSTAAGNVNFRGVGADDPGTPVDLLLSASASGGGAATVNTDSDSIGAANQSMDPNEAVRIDFVSNLTAGAATPTGFGYSGHVDTNSYLQTIPQVQGNQAQTVSFKVWALDTIDTQANTPDRNPVGGFDNSSPVTILEVTVISYDNSTPITLDISGLANGATVAVGYGISVTRNSDGSVTFSGVQEGDQYGINTGGSDFNAVVVQDTVGSFDLGVFAIGQVDTGDPINLHFDLQLTDGDGDTIVVNDALNIQIDPPAAPPVVLDLNGDGVHFLSQDAGVAYDYGNGLVSTAWVAPDDGILVRDANGNGTVDGASEFVFGHDGLTDLQALRAVYGDALDANDADFGKFGVWQDANSNGVVDAGEYQTLAQAGITSVSLVSDGVSYTTADGDVQVAGSGTYTNADGSTGTLADASFLTGGLAQEYQRQAGSDGSLAVAAAVAAAGLAALPAAAQGVDHANQQASDNVDQAAATVHNQVEGREAANDADAKAAAGSADDHGSAASQAPASSSHGEQSSSAGDLAGGHGGHEGAVESLIADDTGSANAEAAAAAQAAPTVNMPAAEALAGLTVAAQHAGAVEQIVAEVLDGAGAPRTIDALLAHLGGGANAKVESAQGVDASAANEPVHGWDMGGHAAFAAHANLLLTMDAMVVAHHDAVQPTANG